MAAPQASNAIVTPSHTWDLPTWGRISRQLTFVNSTHSTFVALATNLVFNLDFHKNKFSRLWTALAVLEKILNDTIKLKNGLKSNHNDH